MAMARTLDLLGVRTGNRPSAQIRAKCETFWLRLSTFARRSVVVLCLGAPLFLGACATGANPGAMTASVSEATLLPQQSRLRRAVEVGTVAGGSETNPLLSSKVSDGDFADALRRSLAVHAILASGSGEYRLDAQLVELKQPFGGFNIEVKTTVPFRLVALRTGRTVFERSITSAYTASFSAAHYGVLRLRLANEDAVRENIQSFIGALVAEERDNPGAFNPVMAELLPQLRKLFPA